VIWNQLYYYYQSSSALGTAERFQKLRNITFLFSFISPLALLLLFLNHYLLHGWHLQRKNGQKYGKVN